MVPYGSDFGSLSKSKMIIITINWGWFSMALLNITIPTIIAIIVPFSYLCE